MSAAAASVEECDQSARSATTQELVAQLQDRNPVARMSARAELVARCDDGAIALLIRALHNGNDRTRWEAAKTLGEIGDSAAAPALVAAMEDEAADVRWVAAEALANLGQDGLATLLGALIRRAGSTTFRQAAHHSIVRMAEEKALLTPVRRALEQSLSAVAAPVAAYTALMAL